MEKLRWIEVAAAPSRMRFDFLSKCLEEAGLPNEVSYLESSPDSLCADLEKLTKEYQQIRIGAPYGEQAVSCFPHSTAQVLFLKTCDAITRQHEKWWTRSFLQAGFMRELATDVKRVDINSSVLLVGSGGAARAVFSALLKIGFTRFTFTDRFEERANIMVKSLKRQYFSVEINFVPPSAITTLPGIHSLLINTTPYVKTNEVLEDLMYFNFFRPGGAIVELCLTPISPPLVQEAERIGAQVIRGYEVASHTDILWAKDACGISLDLIKYRDGLRAELEKIEMNPAEAPPQIPVGDPPKT